ncbi:MAG TPA: efflux RND transporter periplasmic adaptor subunit [Polyangiaceae bacterium]
MSTPTLVEQVTRWSALEVEPAKPAGELWSDPVGSFVKLDETMAARIGVPLPGRVVRVYVELGSQVERGDPLFSVSSADLAILGAERRKAELTLNEAQARLTRVSAIVAAHALPERELFDAVQQLRQAENSLQLANAKKNSLSLGTLSNTVFVVRAPRAGRIVDKQIMAGQQLVARSDRALLTIADLSTLWLITELFEADAPGVHRGSRVRITVPTLPHKLIESEVDTVSAIVDPERRTIPVRVRLDNSDRGLKVNMFAKAQFLLQVPPGTVTVAASALGSDGARSYVYVRDALGQFARREVIPGAMVGGRALIQQGVAENDAVLVRGLSLLDNDLEIPK